LQPYETHTSCTEPSSSVPVGNVAVDTAAVAVGGERWVGRWGVTGGLFLVTTVGVGLVSLDLSLSGGAAS